MIDVGDLVGLIFAGFFALAMVGLTYVFFRLSRTVDQLTKTVGELTASTMPLLGEVTTSVTHVNSELVRVDAITSNVQSITTNVSALSSLFAATLGSPVVKVAAFSYGVRRAAGKRNAADIEKRVKAELKAEKKAARQQ
ncbi:MAG: DUF948 domain-containing protein [Mycobacteriales bacterium]